MMKSEQDMAWDRRRESLGIMMTYLITQKRDHDNETKRSFTTAMDMSRNKDNKSLAAQWKQESQRVKGIPSQAPIAAIYNKIEKNTAVIDKQ